MEAIPGDHAEGPPVLPATPQAPRRNWKVPALFVVIAVVLLPFLFGLEERVRGKLALGQIERRLGKEGVAFDVAGFVGKPDLEGVQNAANLWTNYDKLQWEPAWTTNPPPSFAISTQGRGISPLARDSWVEGNSTGTWAQVSAELQTNKVALSEIRRLLAKKLWEAPREFSYTSYYPNLAKAKKLTQI